MGKIVPVTETAKSKGIAVWGRMQGRVMNLRLILKHV